MRILSRLLLFLTVGVALGGYDPVTYFAEGKPRWDDANIEATYDGALHHFVSQYNCGMFEGNPSRYAPAYGSFCGYAARIGKVRPANPLLRSIVNEQLVVQHTKGAVEQGHVVGATGVSGAKSAVQDEEVAKAGAAALESSPAALSP